MNTSATDQTPEPNDNLIVDFSHRLGCRGSTTTSGMTESITMMTERALGILHLLSIQFDGSCESRLSDVLMCGAIDSAINEIMDVQETVDAFYKHNKKVQP